MSKTVKCDVCGKSFDYGFSVNVDTQYNFDFMNATQDRFEIGQKDVCRDCYYKIKKMLTCCCVKENGEWLKENGTS